MQQSKFRLNNDRSSKDVVMKESISSELRHITVDKSNNTSSLFCLKRL